MTTRTVLISITLISLVIIGGAYLFARSMGIHRFDPSQVPTITVSPGLRPTIAFDPPTAYTLQVYEGPEDGDGLGVLWTARGPGGYENDLHSPVTYGVPPEGSEVGPAPPLESGQVYTVTVYRKDPKGDGDGFFNTRHRYDGQLTFTASEE